MKTQTQHTPGPWVIRKAGTTRLVIEGPNSRMVAETIEYIPSEGEAPTNARLIAAAPEMAEALAYAAGFMSDCTPPPDSLQALVERDPSVRNWLANERGLMLNVERQARSILSRINNP
jgi:hypothetical protein